MKFNQKDKDTKEQPEQPGDVLGVSRAGGPQLPHPPSDGSTPAGIEVRGERKRHWGIEDIPQSDGASGVDMGGGGEGTGISAGSGPRAAAEDEERDLGGVTK